MRRTKKLERENLAYAARLEAVLEELGCKPTGQKYYYKHFVETRAGRLLVDVHPNMCERGAAVLTRFDEPARAVALLGDRFGFAYGNGVNPYSGKWNHHFFSETSVEEAEAIVRREFGRLLGSPP
jgi:hypothetical protein